MINFILNTHFHSPYACVRMGCLLHTCLACGVLHDDCSGKGKDTKMSQDSSCHTVTGFLHEDAHTHTQQVSLLILSTVVHYSLSGSGSS